MTRTDTTTEGRRKGSEPIPQDDSPDDPGFHGGDGDGGGEGDAGGPAPGGGGVPFSPPPGGRSGGFLRPYKPEQGIWTRRGSFVGAGGLIAWGALFLYNQLSIFEGDEGWRLIVTTGIPLLTAVLVGAVAWWLCFVNRKSSDFMIATEGEMKKVSWSTRRELIGSTKVVILFTVLLAAFLFLADVAFQALFSAIGVLKS